VLIPAIGHEKAVQLARYMTEHQLSIRSANEALNLLPAAELNRMLEPAHLCQLGWR